jgi:lipoprotein Spr
MGIFKSKISFIYFLFFASAAIFSSSCRSSKELTKENKNEKPPEISSGKVEKKYAALLNVPPDNITNKKLYSFIDEWYGVPYKYGGKNKDGIDCSNFTCTLYKNIYDRVLSGSSSAIFNQCKVIPKSNLKEGDLVFFKIEKDNISHIGIYLQNNKFVHATTKKGVMINDLDEEYYKKYFYKAGRPVDQ